MTASVVAYSADQWDTHLTLKAECLDCGIEWGWSRDTREAYAWLKGTAEEHNLDFHTQA